MLAVGFDTAVRSVCIASPLLPCVLLLQVLLPTPVAGRRHHRRLNSRRAL